MHEDMDINYPVYRDPHMRKYNQINLYKVQISLCPSQISVYRMNSLSHSIKP